MNPCSRLALALAALALVAPLGGCRAVRGDGSFVWVTDWKDPPQTDEGYLIQPGDLIAVRVFNQDGLSGRARVRADGMISLPFLNEVKAADATPVWLAGRIRDRLKEFVVNPVVTVSLEEARPAEASVVGEVVHPGVYRVESRSGVLALLASAGGLNDFADRERIFVIRGKQRIRFSYRALTEAEPHAAGFRVRSGDVVVVE